MRSVNSFLLASLLTLVAGPFASAQNGSDFKPVDVEVLRKDLSKFWAVGFTFLDTVTESPGATSVQVAKKSYVRFATKSLGDCYADASLGSVLEDLRPGADFVFTATVLQAERSLFSFRSSFQYFVVAMKMQPALAEATPETFLKAVAGLPAESPDGLILKNYNTLLVGLQADLAALARTRNVETSELIKSSSTNRPDVERIITTGIESLADQLELQMPDVLGQLTLALLVSQMQPQPKMEPAKAALPESTPGTVAADPAREKAMAEAKLKEERQKKAALAAEEEARARTAADAEKKRMAEEQVARKAAEKQVRVEQERMKEEQAAAAASKARAEAEAEKKRVAAERAAKAEAAKQAQLERERAAAELKAREEQIREEMEKADAKANEVTPKMRVPSPAKAELQAQQPPVAVPQPAQPSAKLQPTPPPPAPAPGKAPAAPDEDFNAPMPL